MPDPFAQALYDYHFDEMRDSLIYRRGEETEEVGIEHYFDVIDGDS
ncbi:MAG: hypothetical protein SVG88_10095 [Halobacteriales archaeon]|nr:hypothetical protein [Halobacteriales archaeon]